MNVFAFKCLNGTVPFYLCDALTPAAIIYTRVNRSTFGNLLYIPYVNCDLLRQSFEYKAPALWNSLTSLLRKAPSVSDFKKFYKKILF